MKNLNFFTILIILIISISACDENNDLIYNSQDNIYFNYEDDTSAYNILYSFAYTPEIVEDTVFFPVQISGKRVDHNRKFKVQTIDSATTAEPNIHYEPFWDYYEIPADSGTFSLPVVIYNKDPMLNTSTVKLAFTLVPTEDFGVNYPELITGQVQFSNRLEQPGWWIYWMSSLGLYSRVKHQLFLISSGTIDMPDMSQPDAYLQVPKALFHIDQYKAFLSDPFDWVNENEEYALTNTSGENYHFYLKSSPDKTILLQFDEASGNYFFIDENGQIVT